MNGTLLLTLLVCGSKVGPPALESAAHEAGTSDVSAGSAKGGAEKSEHGIPLRPTLSGRVSMEQEAGGSHMRLETNHGPVHLFRPPGFDRKTAGVVVYVHGYYTHIDEAWYEHKLAEQFVASRRNALFIAPEAPAAPEESPSWTTLRRLLKEIATTGKAVGDVTTLEDINVLSRLSAARDEE